MRLNIKKILTTVVALCLLNLSFTGFAAEEETTNLEKQEAFLKRIQSELNLSKTEFRQVKSNMDQTKKRLELLDDDKLSLQKQLNYLDSAYSESQEKLIQVIGEIVSLENEITVVFDDIQQKESEVEAQKELLKDYVRMIYEQQNAILEVDENGEIDAFKLLFADESVGENLKKIEYLDALNEAGEQIVKTLDELTAEMKIRKEELKKKKFTLEKLEKKLSTEKENLEIQKEAKENIMKVTLGQEKIYEQLMEQGRLQEEQSLMQVKELSEALTFIQQKIEEEGANFNPDNYAGIIDERIKAIYDMELNFEGEAGKFNWPVEPERGLSAYFHDPGYRSRFGIGHNAVDIPTAQESLVHAAGNGVVFAARDNGYGYSYVILAHAGGFQTVYGHVSKILVKEGESVRQGEVIALSGGMPGTKGAGYLTTGPHLHFEALLNGNHVDPLDYLPIDHLDSDHIENLPEKYRLLWETLSGVLSRDEDLIER